MLQRVSLFYNGFEQVLGVCFGFHNGLGKVLAGIIGSTMVLNKFGGSLWLYMVLARLWLELLGLQWFWMGLGGKSFAFNGLGQARVRNYFCSMVSERFG